jgi:hypothetical protein
MVNEAETITMSLSAVLLLAAATSGAAQGREPARGVVLAEARVTATILPAASVRRADGQVEAGKGAPRHQVVRRGNRVLVEFE